jgi:hypothetical protein
MKLHTLWLSCCTGMLTFSTLYSAQGELFVRGLATAVGITAAGAVLVGPTGVMAGNTVAFAISALDACITKHPRSKGLAAGSGAVLFLMCVREPQLREKYRNRY